MLVDTPNPCMASAIRRASRKITQIFDAHLGATGLRSTQYTLLSELARSTKPPPSLGELAEEFVMDRSAMGHALKPLERQKLITFAQDPNDGRRKFIQLTKQGRRAVELARPYWLQAQNEVVNFYGDAASEKLRTELFAIADAPRPV